MTLERKLASAMSMDDATWFRHANPWSVWTRASVMPLNGVTAVGAAFTVWGLVDLAVWPTLFGAALVYCGKLWFLDRMVWLYADMALQHEQYRAWLD